MTAAKETNSFLSKEQPIFNFFNMFSVISCDVRLMKTICQPVATSSRRCNMRYYLVFLQTLSGWLGYRGGLFYVEWDTAWAHTHICTHKPRFSSLYFIAPSSLTTWLTSLVPKAHVLQRNPHVFIISQKDDYQVVKISKPEISCVKSAFIQVLI